MDCYFDVPGAPGSQPTGSTTVDSGAADSVPPFPSKNNTSTSNTTTTNNNNNTTTTSTTKKRSNQDAGFDDLNNNNNEEDDDIDNDGAPLTDKQKLERRERNREHAKRSRLRKKFLLESLQEEIHGMQEQLDAMKEALRRELPPHRADAVIQEICGNKDKYTPLPMPSGFGPVKTLMEPDFRLMSALSGSQQNFAISDPTLPDNPIVYVSQGFLDLTGYSLDQVLGRNCRFLQGPGTDQSAVDVIRKGIAEGIDTSVCLLNYKADGTPFWNQFFVAALRDAENNVVNYVGVQCEVSKAVVEKHMETSANAGAKKK
jgi:PAS domain S-box-containing protein